jgi:hypothetical protein
VFDQFLPPVDHSVTPEAELPVCTTSVEKTVSQKQFHIFITCKTERGTGLYDFQTVDDSSPFYIVYHLLKKVMYEEVQKARSEL